jgi:hypothetical protein
MGEMQQKTLKHNFVLNVEEKRLHGRLRFGWGIILKWFFKK